jgi:hypothetical protein
VDYGVEIEADDIQLETITVNPYIENPLYINTLGQDGLVRIMITNSCFTNISGIGFLTVYGGVISYIQLNNVSVLDVSIW